MKILLVEDDEDDVLLLSDLLGRTGIEIESLVHVRSLSEAIVQLEAQEFDIALLDLSLPDARGAGAIRLLLEVRPELPLVVLTGDPRFAMESLRNGAQDYLVKQELEPPLLERTLRYSRERKRHENEIIDLKGRLEDLSERLARLAMTDPLTGLGNRRAFDEMLDAELRRARRHGGALGLMLADLGRFKDVNDSQGHGVGDRVLQALGRALLAAARRAGEGAFRIGGDEFALVLACDVEDDLGPLAERVRRHFSTESPIAGVTLSLGSALVAGNAPDALKTLKRQADRALYAAKNGGGDKHAVDRSAGVGQV